MPGASSPWVDQWAPAQYVYGSSGGGGPTRSPSTDDQAQVAPVNSNNYDPNLTTKLAATIILALVVVFVLQGAGFRFVGAVNVGRG